MKKGASKFLLLLLSGLFLLSLAGCGGSSENSGSNTGLNEEPVTLSILVDKNTSTAGIEAVAAAAEEELGIKVELEIQPGGSEGDNLIKTRLSSGTMNDIVLYNSGSLFLALNPSKYFVDLSGEEFVHSYDDAYTSTVSVDGKIFGVPATSSQGGAWLYNKKIYAELGLEVPKTWDGLLANCEKIKAAGKTAVIGTYKDSWSAQPIFLIDGYNILAEDPSFPEKFTANKAGFANTPIARRSFEKLNSMATYLNADYLSTTYDMGVDMLATGEGAHYPMLTQALTNIYQLYPEAIDDIGVFAQPGDSADSNGLTVYMPNSYYISQSSEKIEAAKAWLEFYVSQEGITAYSTAVKPEGPFVIKGVDLPQDSYAGVIEMQKYFDEGRTAPAIEFLSPIKGPNCPEISVECGSGLITGAEAAAKYDQDCAKQAVQLGLEDW